MFVLQLKTSTSEFAKIDWMFQRGHTTLPCSWNPSGADANEKLFMAACCLIIHLFFWRFVIRRSETITLKDFKVMRKRLYPSYLVTKSGFCVPRKVCSIVKIIPKIDCMGDEWRPMSDDWWVMSDSSLINSLQRHKSNWFQVLATLWKPLLVGSTQLPLGQQHWKTLELCE